MHAVCLIVFGFNSHNRTVFLKAFLSVCVSVPFLRSRWRSGSAVCHLLLCSFFNRFLWAAEPNRFINSHFLPAKQRGRCCLPASSSLLPRCILLLLLHIISTPLHVSSQLRVTRDSGNNGACQQPRRAVRAVPHWVFIKPSPPHRDEFRGGGGRNRLLDPAQSGTISGLLQRRKPGVWWWYTVCSSNSEQTLRAGAAFGIQIISTSLTPDRVLCLLLLFLSNGENVLDWLPSSTKWTGISTKSGLKIETE